MPADVLSGVRPTGQRPKRPNDLGKRAVLNMSKHMVLMEIQKMTFNQYIYSRRVWAMN
jgi:hypothetical protein